MSEEFIGGRHVVRVRKLSEGGYAFVFLMRDVQTGQHLALKTMRNETEEQRAIVRQELAFFQKLGASDHSSPPPGAFENIVRLFGADETSGASGEARLLLEFCDRGHLLSLLEQFPGCQMPEPEVLNCGLQLCNALCLLHQLRMQHRDLKIENVLVSTPTFGTTTGGPRVPGSSSSYQLKLCDFGSWSDEEVPDPRALTGQSFYRLEETVARTTTLMYRPPELADLHSGLPIGVQVDQWDFGCILFMLCFGQHPFQDQSSLAITNCRYRVPERGASQKAGAGSAVDFELSEQVEVSVHSLLAYDPRERPSSGEYLQFLLGRRRAAGAEASFLPVPDSVVARLQRDAKLYGARIPDFIRKRKIGGAASSSKRAAQAQRQADWRARRRGAAAPSAATTKTAENEDVPTTHAEAAEQDPPAASRKKKSSSGRNRREEGRFVEEEDAGGGKNLGADSGDAGAFWSHFEDDTNAAGARSAAEQDDAWSVPLFAEQEDEDFFDEQAFFAGFAGEADPRASAGSFWGHVGEGSGSSGTGSGAPAASKTKKNSSRRKDKNGTPARRGYEDFDEHAENAFPATAEEIFPPGGDAGNFFPAEEQFEFFGLQIPGAANCVFLEHETTSVFFGDTNNMFIARTFTTMAKAKLVDKPLEDLKKTEESVKHKIFDAIFFDSPDRNKKNQAAALAELHSQEADEALRRVPAADPNSSSGAPSYTSAAAADLHAAGAVQSAGHSFVADTVATRFGALKIRLKDGATVKGLKFQELVCDVSLWNDNEETLSVRICAGVLQGHGAEAQNPRDLEAMLLLPEHLNLFTTDIVIKIYDGVCKRWRAGFEDASLVGYCVVPLSELWADYDLLSQSSGLRFRGGRGGKWAYSSKLVSSSGASPNVVKLDREGRMLPTHRFREFLQGVDPRAGKHGEKWRRLAEFGEKYAFSVFSGGQAEVVDPMLGNQDKNAEEGSTFSGRELQLAGQEEASSAGAAAESVATTNEEELKPHAENISAEGTAAASRSSSNAKVEVAGGEEKTATAKSKNRPVMFLMLLFSYVWFLYLLVWLRYWVCTYAAAKCKHYALRLYHVRESTWFRKTWHVVQHACLRRDFFVEDKILRMLPPTLLKVEDGRFPSKLIPVRENDLSKEAKKKLAQKLLEATSSSTKPAGSGGQPQLHHTPSLPEPPGSSNPVSGSGESTASYDGSPRVAAADKDGNAPTTTSYEKKTFFPRLFAAAANTNKESPARPAPIRPSPEKRPTTFFESLFGRSAPKPDPQVTTVLGHLVVDFTVSLRCSPLQIASFGKVQIQQGSDVLDAISAVAHVEQGKEFWSSRFGHTRSATVASLAGPGDQRSGQSSLHAKGPVSSKDPGATATAADVSSLERREAEIPSHRNSVGRELLLSTQNTEVPDLEYVTPDAAALRNRRIVGDMDAGPSAPGGPSNSPATADVQSQDAAPASSAPASAAGSLAVSRMVTAAAESEGVAGTTEGQGAIDEHATHSAGPLDLQSQRAMYEHVAYQTVAEDLSALAEMSSDVQLAREISNTCLDQWRDGEGDDGADDEEDFVGASSSVFGASMRQSKSSVGTSNSGASLAAGGEDATNPTASVLEQAGDEKGGKMPEAESRELGSGRELPQEAGHQPGSGTSQTILDGLRHNTDMFFKEAGEMLKQKFVQKTEKRDFKMRTTVEQIRGQEDQEKDHDHSIIKEAQTKADALRDQTSDIMKSFLGSAASVVSSASEQPDGITALTRQFSLESGSRALTTEDVISRREEDVRRQSLTMLRSAQHEDPLAATPVLASTGGGLGYAAACAPSSAEQEQGAGSEASSSRRRDHGGGDNVKEHRLVPQSRRNMLKITSPSTSSPPKSGTASLYPSPVAALAVLSSKAVRSRGSSKETENELTSECRPGRRDTSKPMGLFSDPDADVAEDDSSACRPQCRRGHQIVLNVDADSLANLLALCPDASAINSTGKTSDYSPNKMIRKVPSITSDEKRLLQFGEHLQKLRHEYRVFLPQRVPPKTKQLKMYDWEASTKRITSGFERIGSVVGDWPSLPTTPGGNLSCSYVAMAAPSWAFPLLFLAACLYEGEKRGGKQRGMVYLHEQELILTKSSSVESAQKPARKAAVSAGARGNYSSAAQAASGAHQQHAAAHLQDGAAASSGTGIIIPSHNKTTSSSCAPFGSISEEAAGVVEHQRESVEESENESLLFKMREVLVKLHEFSRNVEAVASFLERSRYWMYFDDKLISILLFFGLFLGMACMSVVLYLGRMEYFVRLGFGCLFIKRAYIKDEMPPLFNYIPDREEQEHRRLYRKYC
eukprot:g1776.t1